MITERQLRRVRAEYCCDDISKIENYDKALTDLDVRYECHHRLEVGENGEVVSREGLVEHGLYYNRPASELIFLTQSEHRILHKKGNKNTLGKHHSEETKRKMSEARKAYYAKRKAGE